MRIVKEYDERRNEIIDQSKMLFASKGYEKTTINDILKAVNIAKGTFYYYFKTKEDVLDAIIDQIIEEETMRAQKNADNPKLSAKEKLFMILLGSKESEEGEMKEEIKNTIHKVDNSKMHQKSIVAMVKRLTPIITQVIEEGIDEGVFNTPYPKESVEFILVSSSFLFDEGIFDWTMEELQIKVNALIHLMELIFGTKEGELAYLIPTLRFDGKAIDME